MAWELDNIKTLCYFCHIFWWHKNPVEAAAWIKTALPASRLAKLKKLSQQTLPKPDLLKVKAEYEKVISKYG
jgi:hypothetical protein